jgi:hypothetical protein
MSNIVTKCLAAPKTKTKELSLQIILMYVEIERHEAVMEELIKVFDHKNPKVVSACINVATAALRYVIILTFFFFFSSSLSLSLIWICYEIFQY